jgi:hypothetical protein
MPGDCAAGICRGTEDAVQKLEQKEAELIWCGHEGRSGWDLGLELVHPPKELWGWSFRGLGDYGLTCGATFFLGGIEEAEHVQECVCHCEGEAQDPPFADSAWPGDYRVPQRRRAPTRPAQERWGRGTGLKTSHDMANAEMGIWSWREFSTGAGNFSLHGLGWRT